MSSLAFSVKFYLGSTSKDGKKYPIYMRVIVNRMKAEAFLFEYADPDKWISECGRIKGNAKSDQFLNNKLTAAENTINEIRWSLERDKKPFTAKDVINRYKGEKNDIGFLQFFSQVIKEIEAKPDEYTKSVVRHYYQARLRLQEYLKKKAKNKDMLLRNFSRKHIDEFEHYLLTTRVEVIDKPICRNTANRYLVKLKCVFNIAIRKELIIKNPFADFKIREVKSNRSYLTQQELEQIESHPLSGNPSLIRVRDIFLFSVYTGLRWSDAMSLTDKSIQKDKKERYWIYLAGQLKTGEPLVIPMLRQAQDIYEKYAECREITKFILPRLSNQKVNSYLKEICRLVGIEKSITHHCGRHSFATTILLERGVDLKTVSKLLGHRSVRSSEVYGKITQTQLSTVAEKVEFGF